MQLRLFSVGVSILTATLAVVLGYIALPVWPNDALTIELVMSALIVAHLVVMMRLIMIGPFTEKRRRI